MRDKNITDSIHHSHFLNDLLDRPADINKFCLGRSLHLEYLKHLHSTPFKKAVYALSHTIGECSRQQKINKEHRPQGGALKPKFSRLPSP
jgi:hypothetical protein